MQYTQYMQLNLYVFVFVLTFIAPLMCYPNEVFNCVEQCPTINARKADKENWAYVPGRFLVEGRFDSSTDKKVFDAVLEAQRLEIDDIYVSKNSLVNVGTGVHAVLTTFAVKFNNGLAARGTFNYSAILSIDLKTRKVVDATLINYFDELSLGNRVNLTSTARALFFGLVPTVSAVTQKVMFKHIVNAEVLTQNHQMTVELGEKVILPQLAFYLEEHPDTISTIDLELSHQSCADLH